MYQTYTLTGVLMERMNCGTVLEVLGDPQLLSVEEVQKIIDKKNTKLAGYRRNCRRVWLAIDNRLRSWDSTQSQMRQDNFVTGMVLIESFGLKCVEGILYHVMSLFYQLSEKICLNHVLMCFKYMNFVGEGEN